uniref:Uncharacterized protein n=1 Tax=Salix viminalis TaxID=40686 RepID=A0A6N2KZM1_SALVM
MSSGASASGPQTGEDEVGGARNKANSLPAGTSLAPILLITKASTSSICELQYLDRSRRIPQDLFGNNGKDLANVSKNDSVNHLAIFQQTSNAEHPCAFFEVLQYKRSLMDLEIAMGLHYTTVEHGWSFSCQFLNLRSTCTAIPHRKPSAALEPTSETAAHISITKASSFVFMSLEAIANSIPANNSSTPRTPTGNWFKTMTKELPKTKPRTNLAAPSRATQPPLLPPNLYCPASPPAPWQHGMAPNQHPTMFIIPTETEMEEAEKSFPGNRSDDKLHTAITEFSTDRGS